MPMHFDNSLKKLRIYSAALGGGAMIGMGCSPMDEPIYRLNKVVCL